MKSDIKVAPRDTVGTITGADRVSKKETATTLTKEELLHLCGIVTMGQLAACFAHEVSNPMTLIKGHLRFVSESLGSDDPLRVNFEAIERSSRRIEELAKRMLDFSRRRVRRVSRCDMAEIVTEALQFVQPYLRRSFIDVRLDLAADLPFVAVDRWQMLQALVNVLQNAADAMEEVNGRLLSVTANVDGGHARIVVTDTGAGIPSANVSKIFDPFFTTKGDRGTGLGLYITRQIIEEHRGTIDIRTSNRGTSFVISLPL